MSNSHLIPEVLGGKFQFRISCKECNEQLGHKYESKVKKNAFLAAAISKLGIKSAKEAYRHAKIIDDETGFLMKLDAGQVTPKPKELSKGKFMGSRKDQKLYHVSRFKKKHPDVDTTPLEKFFDDPQNKSFRFHGHTYRIEEYSSKEITVRIEGLTQEIVPELVFKILYEFLSLNGFLSHPVIGPKMREYVTLGKVNEKTTVVIKPDVARVILGNIYNTFSWYKKLEEIPFKDHHYFIFRMTRKGILYCELVLFGQIRNFFIIGQWSPSDDEIFSVLGRAFIFPMSGGIFGPIVYENVSRKAHITWADAAVDIRTWELEQNN